MNLSQRLQNLPFELHYMIIEKYKNMYIFPEIVKRNKTTLERLKYKLNEFDIEPEDLIDVSNISIFNRILNQKNDVKGKYFIYSEKCITGFIEYYYSLTFYERKTFNNSVLQGKIYNIIKKYDDDDDNDDNDNDKYDDKYIIDNRRLIHYNFIDFILLNKNLSNLIDPDDFHSGASAGWCMSNIIPIIFGNYEKRLEHWIKLIQGHFKRSF